MDRVCRGRLRAAILALCLVLAPAAAIAAAQAPADGASLSESAALGGGEAGAGTTQDSAYMLPWPNGYAWTKWYGWHGTGFAPGDTGIDFSPSADASADATVALAAASGTLTEVCGAAQGDTWQSTLRIDHIDGFTLYLHIDATTVPRDLLGQWVRRGQYLGHLYRGQLDGYGGCANGPCFYSTPCGSGTNVHLHFQFSSADAVVDGYNASDIANSADGTAWLSHNVAIGYSVPEAATAAMEPAVVMVAATSATDTKSYLPVVLAVSDLPESQTRAASARPITAASPSGLPGTASRAGPGGTSQASTLSAAGTPMPSVPTPLPAVATPTPEAVPPPADYVWEGQLALALDGTYLLLVSSSSPAELWLDGALAAEGDVISTETTLSAGSHSLRLVCREAGYGASATFSYTYTGPAHAG